MKYIRTDVSVDVSGGTGAVVSEAREFVAVDQPEVLLNDVLASYNVGAEPGSVSRRAGRDTRNVSVGVSGISLGVRSGSSELGLPGRRAADEANSLVVDTGDGKVARDVDLSSVLNGGIDVLDGAINIDVGEQVRWLDGVPSRARQSEVVRSGN